mmetsp:Transcript_21514/g.57848  ORF Transcript_21514/g.57848 Transcript_21514/m.57848 type:complete len:305 (-) Transcript_21514:10-924(-)
MNPPHQTKLDEGNDAARPAINRKAKAQQGHEARARHLGKWLLWRLMSSSAGLSVQRALHGHHRQQQHLLDPASSLQALERLLLVQLLLIGDALLVLACPRLLLLLRRISRTTRSPPLSLRCVHVPSIRELRPRVNLAQEACLFRVLLVLLHEELSRVLIERRLGEGVDQQASDDLHNVSQRNVLLPVPLERVHAHLPRLRDVRMEDLCEEIALGRRLWKVEGKCKLHAPYAALVRRALGSLDVDADICDVFLVDIDFDPSRWCSGELAQLARHRVDHCWCNILIRHGRDLQKHGRPRGILPSLT